MQLIELCPGTNRIKAHWGNTNIFFYIMADALWNLNCENRSSINVSFPFVLLTDRGQMTQWKETQLSVKRKTHVLESSWPLKIALWLYMHHATSLRFRNGKEKHFTSGTAWVVDRLWYVGARESWFCHYYLGNLWTICFHFLFHSLTYFKCSVYSDAALGSSKIKYVALIYGSSEFSVKETSKSSPATYLKFLRA